MRENRPPILVKIATAVACFGLGICAACLHAAEQDLPPKAKEVATKFETYKKTATPAAIEAKRKQVTFQVKEVRLRPKTDKHDRSIKMERAKRFLGTGCRVQLNMLFRGREMAHEELGREKMDRIALDLKEVAEVFQHPRMEGRTMHMLIQSIKKK